MVRGIGFPIIVIFQLSWINCVTTQRFRTSYNDLSEGNPVED